MQSDNKDNIGSDDIYTKVLIVLKTIIKKVVLTKQSIWWSYNKWSADGKRDDNDDSF